MDKRSNHIEFKEALNRACAEINEAARLSESIFQEDDLKLVRRELARLMEKIDLEILPCLEKVQKFK